MAHDPDAVCQRTGCTHTRRQHGAMAGRCVARVQRRPVSINTRPCGCVAFLATAPADTPAEAARRAGMAAGRPPVAP